MESFVYRHTLNMFDEKLRQLSKKLGYEFTHLSLLRSAITHRSMGGTHNERLEFLGDSLLNFSIAAELYRRYPKAREGELTRMRSKLVREETLAEIARFLALGDYLQLGIGEQKSGGQKRNSILSDALEAVIGAIYLDSNTEICCSRILAWYENRLNSLKADVSQKDAKTELQEYLQARRLPLPEYKVIGIEGDPHSPIFRVQCTVSILERSFFGIANSRRKAEQYAATEVLEQLKALGRGL